MHRLDGGGLQVLVTAGTTDYKLRTKLMGLELNSRVGEILLVRRHPLAGLSKIRNVNPPSARGEHLLAYELWRWQTLRRLLCEEHIDLLIGVYLILHGTQAVLAGRSRRTPIVVSAIGDDIHIHQRTFWYGPLVNWTLRNADRVVILGPASRDLLAVLGVEDHRMHEIQNYQDPSRFEPDEVVEPEWDLVFVGDLIPRKRVDILLRTTACLPGVRLAIVGDGTERVRLEALVAELGVTGRVDFLGRRDAVEDLLHRSRVLVMPSSVEGVPAAAIEAMYCGLPVVLTDVGDVAGTFRDGDNALLVPPGDDAALGLALVRVLGDPGCWERLHCGALAAREQHRRKWGEAGQVAAWDRLLDSLEL